MESEFERADNDARVNPKRAADINYGGATTPADRDEPNEAPQSKPTNQNKDGEAGAPIPAKMSAEEQDPIADGVLDRQESWIDLVASIPRDEAAVFVGPRKFQKFGQNSSKDEAPVKEEKPKEERSSQKPRGKRSSSELAALLARLKEQENARKELEKKLEKCEKHREEERKKRERDNDSGHFEN